MKLSGKLVVGALAAALVLPSAFAGTAESSHAESSHEKAARELVRVIGGTAMVESGAEAMMGVVRQNPELAPYEDVFRAWYKKIFAEGDLEGELAAVYMKHFSEEELRGLIAFYKTPLGQKLLTNLPAIMKEGAEIGMKRAQAHQDELIEMVNKAKAERESKGDTPKK